jgi:glycosyltransferase involved in cell wall biosynthesis
VTCTRRQDDFNWPPMHLAARPRDLTNTGSPLLVLLDLAGDETAAQAWAKSQAPSAEILTIHKADLKRATKLEALKRIRSLNPDVLGIFTTDAYLQNSRSAMMLFGAVSGARTILVGDGHGSLISRSRTGALLCESARLFLELAAGYLILVPVVWLLTVALRWWVILKDIESVGRAAPRGRHPGVKSKDANRPEAPQLAELISTENPIGQPSGLRILYLLASPLATRNGIPGGMGTHVTGFLGGVRALGAKVTVVTSVDPALDGSDTAVSVIAPSGAIGATKALFEIWNSLRFTVVAAIALARINRDNAEPAGRIDFNLIYQRYNRFNCAGVVLSLLSDIPLVLEYNGSEVWVGDNWDPVGQRALLASIERLNHRAAGLIVTISEVERRNLIAAGVHPSRIVVNPNGVDTDRFRPDCGGRELRHELGIQDKIVVGFLGTFAPFHGAEILARAAVEMEDRGDCHFMFIGDGDLRPAAEAIFAAAARSSSVTFTGKIAHKSAPAYLDACDILVSPQMAAKDGTEFFGSPTKIFEYMAMARPVIASRLGQIAETVVDGETGILVEPGDVNQLADAIRRLKNDEALGRRLGEAGRRRVCERFTWRRNASAVFDAVKPLLKNADRRRHEA